MPTRGTDPAGLPVFVYGSLLDPLVLARQSGRRGLMRLAVPAVLPGWRRVGLRGTAFPTLVRARGCRTEGVLLRLRGAPMRRLMAYEGAAYRLRWIRVRTARGPRQARAWMAAASLAGRTTKILVHAQS
ncbi:gamma-glutamylcyclotransferase family protein [Falsiroseomonas sp. E2-1-a20]|uniref:gamma-glutamylcyclotransferase family protein n=1 Tax=Falsiroseomonas sp. E2-1-a20 TaxID=3239300 RepID=UPI003F2FD0D9